VERRCPAAEALAAPATRSCDQGSLFVGWAVGGVRLGVSFCQGVFFWGGCQCSREYVW
jgi:hypothetical protein